LSIFHPTVLVGLPHNGTITPGAARGFHVCTAGAVRLFRGRDEPSGDPRLLNGSEFGSSFLPGAFNSLLVNALDLRDRGAVTHFAMIHSDVEPSGYWLDELWAEMQAGDFAVVSAVIALKEDVPDPQVSTAIGDARDRWNSLRCLHVSDRDRLPQTFTAADVCGPDEVLLLNTGLWLTDLRHPFWDAFTGFDTHARITRGNEGQRIAQQRTEDWEWSHDLHDFGASVAATWRVPVKHRGGRDWPNYAPDTLPAPWARRGLASLDSLKG
jgi:hypothetical protein